MNSVRVRYATFDDESFIIESQLKMAKETENLDLDRVTVTSGVKSVFNDSQKGFYIVGEVNGDVVSCLMITPEWSDWRSNWVWWIQSIYVADEMRKSGIFSNMYTFIKEIVSKKSDVAGIRLYVDNTNLNARQVYRKIGMTDEHYRLFEWMK
jgi:ribosomal protein S18 acetylase RimI-like enzyme